MASSSLALSPVSLWKAGDTKKADVNSCGLISVERYLEARREPSAIGVCNGKMSEFSLPQETHCSTWAGMESAVAMARL